MLNKGTEQRRHRNAAAFAVWGCAILAAPFASASDNNRLVELINAYRQAPQQCDGKQLQPVQPLAPDPMLARVKVEQGKQLQHTLKEAGYQAARAQAIAVSGPTTPNAVMKMIQPRYCSILLDSQLSAIGVSQSDNTWHIVLAQPLLSGDLGSWQEAGKKLVELVNAARAEPRRCGNKKMPAAPPVKWNEKLAATALAHSRDMANQDFFSHKAKDGSTVDTRATRNGYKWRHIGENIATGQGSPQQAMSGWLASPGHCVNLMNRNFTEMGAAYALNPKTDTTIYWTQVFGTPRR